MTYLDDIISKLKVNLPKTTNGPWFFHDFSGVSDNPKASDITVSCDHPATITIAEMGKGVTGDLKEAEANALHISLANPETVTLLLIRIAQLEAECEKLRALPGPFNIGDRVEKIKGSCRRGKVVGFYSTTLTPIGYNVESENEPGSVQIYPAWALEKKE